jgi:hypothetical protein
MAERSEKHEAKLRVKYQILRQLIGHSIRTIRRNSTVELSHISKFDAKLCFALLSSLHSPSFCETQKYKFSIINQHIITNEKR